MRFEAMLQSAKDKLNAITPNDVLKLVGLQLLDKRGQRFVPGWPLLAAFGGGLVLGASSALLLAPKSGKEMRKALVSWVEAAFSRVAQEAEADSEASAEEPALAPARSKNGKSKSVGRDLMT